MPDTNNENLKNLEELQEEINELTTKLNDKNQNLSKYERGTEIDKFKTKLGAQVQSLNNKDLNNKDKSENKTIAIKLEQLVKLSEVLGSFEKLEEANYSLTHSSLNPLNIGKEHTPLFKTLEGSINSLAKSIIEKSISQFIGSNVQNTTDTSSIKENLPKAIEKFPDQQKEFGKYVGILVAAEIIQPTVMSSTVNNITDLIIAFKSVSNAFDIIKQDKELFKSLTKKISEFAGEAEKDNSMLNVLNSLSKLYSAITPNKISDKNLVADIKKLIITTLDNDLTNDFPDVKKAIEIADIINLEKFKKEEINSIFEKTKPIFANKDLVNIDTNTLKNINSLIKFIKQANGLKLGKIEQIFSAANNISSVASNIENLITSIVEQKTITDTYIEKLELLLDISRGKIDLNAIDINQEIKPTFATHNTKKLFTALKTDNIKEFEKILNNGWGVDYKSEQEFDKELVTLLECAAADKNQGFLKSLYKNNEKNVRKAIVEDIKEGQKTVFHFIAFNNRLDNLKFTLGVILKDAKKNDIEKVFNVESKNGNTALSLALDQIINPANKVNTNALEIIKLLVKNGADIKFVKDSLPLYLKALKGNEILQTAFFTEETFTEAFKDCAEKNSGAENYKLFFDNKLGFNLDNIIAKLEKVPNSALSKLHAFRTIYIESLEQHDDTKNINSEASTTNGKHTEAQYTTKTDKTQEVDDLSDQTKINILVIFRVLANHAESNKELVKVAKDIKSYTKNSGDLYNGNKNQDADKAYANFKEIINNVVCKGNKVTIYISNSIKDEFKNFLTKCTLCTDQGNNSFKVNTEESAFTNNAFKPDDYEYNIDCSGQTPD